MDNYVDRNAIKIFDGANHIEYNIGISWSQNSWQPLLSCNFNFSFIQMVAGGLVWRELKKSIWIRHVKDTIKSIYKVYFN